MSVRPVWPLPLAQELQPRASPPLTEKGFWAPVLLNYFILRIPVLHFLCIEDILQDKFKP